MNVFDTGIPIEPLVELFSITNSKVVFMSLPDEEQVVSAYQQLERTASAHFRSFNTLLQQIESNPLYFRIFFAFNSSG